MLFNFDDGHGAQALDQNQLARRLQFSVATGCAVSPGTNDLTVQVSAGGVIFDGASVSVSAQDNVTLASPDSADPRKDVVYVDGTGDVKVATGTPEPAQPAGQIRRDTFRPAPPDLAAMNAVVLAEVWVSAQASDIVADDISDRRLFADAAFRNVKSESVSTGRTIIGNSNIDSRTVTVADDDVATLDIPSNENNEAMIFVRAETSGPGDNGGLYHTAFASLNAAALGSNHSNEGGTNTLSGTDGPDGSLNVSKEGTTLYMENRLGAESDVVVYEVS